MGVIDNVKTIVELVSKIDNIELYRKILDLQSEVIELVEENRKQKNEIESLNEKLRLKEKVTFRDNVCWIEGESLPYCSKCFDSNVKLIHLHLYDDGSRGECPNCKIITVIKERDEDGSSWIMDSGIYS